MVGKPQCKNAADRQTVEKQDLTIIANEEICHTSLF